MDQKNTIVKCNRSPKCLFAHHGICDNYVITIGADGSCQEYVETEMIIEETKRCHEDCIHFDDSDPMVGPICLFKHPEPLKDFYEGMPGGYYHSTNYISGQRAKCNLYEDTCGDKETVIAAIQGELLRQQMCWYCDNGSHGSCKLTAKPSLDRNGKCPSYKSTGGNR